MSYKSNVAPAGGELSAGDLRVPINVGAPGEDGWKVP